MVVELLKLSRRNFVVLVKCKEEEKKEDRT
jgi:hypothetical protein